MSHTLRLALTAPCLLALAGAAHAQKAALENPGFEQSDLNAEDAFCWREFFPARRREIGDSITGDPLVRSGIASMELPDQGVFAGFDTNELDINTFELCDPIYEYGCGPAILRAWYAIPATNPLEYGFAGLKFEFRRNASGNTSIYLAVEDLMIRPQTEGATGHTDGMFEQVQLAVWPAFFDLQHHYANMGDTYGGFPQQAPMIASILPLRFVPPENVPQGESEDNVMYWDDIEYIQDKTGAEFDEYIIWDDAEVSARAVLDQGGVQEQPVPITFTGDSTVYAQNDQIGFGCLPSTDVFDAINISDRVPGTNEYPQTFADLVANGFVRAVHQNGDGSAGVFGTSVITAPSFRKSGQPLDLIPDISTSNINWIYNFPNYVPGDNGLVPDGPPLRSDFQISTTGAYGSDATVTSVRDYSVDPVIGETSFEVQFTFDATSDINLQAAKAVGNDAFRLITLSSMFASRASGEYDGSYLQVQETGGGTTQLVLEDSTPRDTFLFGAPVETAVGSTFTLFQDDQATFNPDSPSISVEIVSLTGVSGRVGVQGFLAPSLDPNDDSLSVWLEWIDAPATIPNGTQIAGTFIVRATPPTAVPGEECPGDVDGDGDTDVFDFAELASNFGAGPDATRAEGDLNGDGFVDVFDFAELASDFGCGQ